MKSPAGLSSAALRLDVFGVVQGVGFRPFVVRLARRFRLTGWVKNDGRGVQIHVEGGTRGDRERFAGAIETDRPPLARIERVTSRTVPVRGYRDFKVRASGRSGNFVFISPDISVCPACRDEIRDPGNRRFGYPFTNCTDCGPRYTIVRDLPYDRPQTTMADFPLCPDCRREYHDPLDRRYHAQPIACPVCGPSVALRNARTGKTVPGGIEKAADLVRRGKILAVKGLGGFHLVCDPADAGAVARLRRVKKRAVKPLALMVRDISVARRIARISPPEAAALESDRRPIVLVQKRVELPGVAPGLNEVGIMLPYTPLHVLLLDRIKMIVATSSNPKDAPIIKDESEGFSGLCDYILTHNRPIHMRADDSVVRIIREAPVFLRRARGYVPYPQPVPRGFAGARPILALGAELKNTVSVFKNGYVVTSQFLGDLDEYRNRMYFEETLAHLTGLFRVKPACVVSDLHPDFHTTRIAERMGLPHFRVQHHHAHVLAVLLEHGLEPGTRVLGIVWDGYGYGLNGEAWGGEFLIAGYDGFNRFARFEPKPLPGGDLAAREPWRMALSYLWSPGLKAIPAIPGLRPVDPARRRAVWEMIASETHSPLASSCGRLFDAVSALTGLAPLRNEYEAEAAVRLEAAAAPGRTRPYAFMLHDGNPKTLSFDATIREIISDIKRGVSPAIVSARFHETLASAAVETAEKARRELGIRTIVLGGGVFCNRRLLGRVEDLLTKSGFSVLRPRQYSPNDESISVGQVAFALARLSPSG
ncbi:MAG: carbamoyltransferase HypF [Candidatus Aminicenantes bacterium]|nr:carbamoyltransferase HypF [Candidatus Aminicenantes bacterium]